MSKELQIAPDEFTLLLRAFNKAVEGMPPKEKIRQELEDIKASAETSVDLNDRQKDAIVARVKNYFNGTYGNTKAGVSFSSPQDAKK